MKQLIIGVGGQKRAGKNTVAEAMAEEYGGSNIREACLESFAAPIKNMLQYLFRNEVSPALFTDDRCKTSLVHITDDFSLSVRTMLQLVGTDCFRDKIHPDFWVYRAINNIKHNNLEVIIFTDLRFKNELDIIKKLGGVTVYVERTDQEEGTDMHASEVAMLEFKDAFDVKIAAPSGDVAAVKNMARDIFKDIYEDFTKK